MVLNKRFTSMSHRDKIKIRNAFEDIFGYYDVPEKIKIERILYAMEFLKYSDQDISSAKMLYDNGVYSNSLYFLQQSVEKLSKSYASGFFFLDKKNIKNVSHYSPLACIKILEKFSSFLTNMEIALYSTGIINREELGLKNLSTKRYENMLKKTAKDAARMEFAEISSLLNIGKRTTSLFENPDFKGEIQELLLSSKEDIQLYTREEDKEKETQAVDFILNNLDEFFTDNYYMYLTELYILGIITYPHENQTRYPDAGMRFDEYNEELGIVQQFNNIFDRVVFFRKELERFFNQELEKCRYER